MRARVKKQSCSLIVIAPFFEPSDCCARLPTHKFKSRQFRFEPNAIAVQEVQAFMTNVRSFVLIALALTLVGVRSAEAEIAGGKIKIGVLNDQSSLYADATGHGSVVAAELAVEDFRATNRNLNVEIVFADHQNKADVGSAIVRRWKDVDKVDAVVDVPNSAVALALNELLRGTNVAFLPSSAATADLTGVACSPNTVQWVFDTWALAHGTGRAVTKNGGKNWYFLTVDYTAGYQLEREATRVIEANDGKVIGSVRHPLNTADFSSFLLSAQASNADVIGLANIGGDTINSIKQASEFGISSDGKHKMAALLIFINDIHSLGLQTAQGLLLTTAFYWDLNDSTRNWSKRFSERNNGKMPNMNQAGVYSTVLAYLKAAESINSVNGRDVVTEMKRMKINDPLFANVKIRSDGRVLHDMYLARVKKPSQSNGPWDYYDILATISANEAFRPIDEGNCPMVKQAH
jgi:branched-chain amino acid transport system substrate-binding protein